MISHSIDVSGIQPIAREIVHQAAEAYLDHFGDELVSFVAHGSAVKGGYIEGASDVDVKAFVRPEVLTPGGTLPMERAIDLHRLLSAIDIAPFRYLQGYVETPGLAPGHGFIPGTYHVVTGSNDIPILSNDELLQSAHAALYGFTSTRYRDARSNALLDCGEGRLDRQVRYLCTEIWPTMNHVCTVVRQDGIGTWQLIKPEIVAILENDSIIGTPLTAWWETINRHYWNGESIETALEAIKTGTILLDAVETWANTQLTRIKV